MINWFLSKESLLGAQHHGVEAMKAMKAMKVSKIAKGKGWLSMVSTRELDGEVLSVQKRNYLQLALKENMGMNTVRPCSSY